MDRVRGLLSQVLLNLLTNVERYAYARETGGPVEIVLGQTADGRNDRFSIIVRDSGRGMAPETRDRIFEPFYTTGRSKGATGLGMAIVHNLMTSALGGTVEVTFGKVREPRSRSRFPRAFPRERTDGGGTCSKQNGPSSWSTTSRTY